MQTMVGYELRDATRADGEELTTLFNRVFRSNGDARPPRSPAAWDWRGSYIRGRQGYCGMVGSTWNRVDVVLRRSRKIPPP